MLDEVIKFWFEDIDHQLWWEKNPDFDQLIRDRFLTLHQQAASGELFQWRETVIPPFLTDIKSRGIFIG